MDGAGAASTGTFTAAATRASTAKLKRMFMALLLVTAAI